jgi:hypothetical protein
LLLGCQITVAIHPLREVVAATGPNRWANGASLRAVCAVRLRTKRRSLRKTQDCGKRCGYTNCMARFHLVMLCCDRYVLPIADAKDLLLNVLLALLKTCTGKSSRALGQAT